MVNTTEEDMDSGNCLSEAFSMAGVDYSGITINPWPLLSEIEIACKALELKFHSRETDTLPPKGVPVIAIYHTEGVKSHAEYTTNLDLLSKQDKTFIAYIEAPILISK